MPDPVTPLTREHIGLVLISANQRKWDNDTDGQCQIHALQDYLRKVCDSHEALRAETEAQREARKFEWERAEHHIAWVREEQAKVEKAQAEVQRLTGLLDGLRELTDRLDDLANDGMTLVHCPKCDPEDYDNPAAECCEECPRQLARDVLARLTDGSR